MSDAEHTDLLSLLERSITAAKSLCASMRIAPRSKHEKLYALMTLYELVRKGESVLAMAKANADSGIPIVVRAAFENYVDIVNLLRHKGTYVAYMTYLSWRQQRSLFQGALDNPESEYSKSLIRTGRDEHNIEVAEQVAFINRQMGGERQQLTRDYMKKNREPSDPHAEVETSERHRFVLAGRADEYEMIYRYLSAAVHGRVTAMLRGIASEDGIVWPPEDTSERQNAAVDIMTAFILEGAMRIGRRYDQNIAQLAAVQRERAQVLQRLGYGAASLPE